MNKIFTSFDGLLEKFSRVGLIFSFSLILLLAVSSIVFRWLGMSFMWMEPFTRHLVFLSAFFGGSLATSKGVHIRVDLLSKLVEKSSSKVLHWLHRNLIILFCFVTTAVLTKAAIDLFIMEREFGAPSFLEIHSSYLVGIIPFGIGLISLRFFNQLFIGPIPGELSEHHRVH